MLECVICFEEYDNKQCKMFLECGHHMCSSCFTKINLLGQSCPYCRQDFKISNLTWKYILHYAIMMNKRKLFYHVLKNLPYGHYIYNEKSELGNTALHIACFNNRFINELLNKGVETMTKNNAGKIALEYLRKDHPIYHRLRSVKKFKLYKRPYELTSNFNDFKKFILSGKYPSKKIIREIEEKSLEDHKNFLVIAGYY